MWPNGGCDNGNSFLYYIKWKLKICLKNEFVTCEKLIQKIDMIGG